MGYIDRKAAVEMVRQYDHVVSDDLYYWLDYIERSKDWFWDIANRFRDLRVWRRDLDVGWKKDNIWDLNAE
jgi:hypothetical protein